MDKTLILLSLLFVIISLQVVQSFRLQPRLGRFVATVHKARALRNTKQDYIVGENIPHELLNMHPIYDMVLVERFNEPERSAGGLFIPKAEGRDRKYLGKVVAMPTSSGIETSEKGHIQPIEEVMPYKVGDVVAIRDPWGIGPKDFQFGDRCFSIHKAGHILGLVSN